VGYIGGDTHTAGAAIAAPLRILGQQPVQNAAPTPTMFIIVNDPFCCNQTLRILHLHYLFVEPPICHQNAPNRVLNFKKKFRGNTPDPHTLGDLPQTTGERERGRGRSESEVELERKGGEGIIHLLLPPKAHTAIAAYDWVVQKVGVYWYPVNYTYGPGLCLNSNDGSAELMTKLHCTFDAELQVQLS